MRIVAPRPPDRLARLANGLARDRAGVDEDGIVQPGLLSLASHHFGFVGIEPAAEGNDLHAAHRTDAISECSSRENTPVAGSTLPDHSHSAGPVMTT